MYIKIQDSEVNEIYGSLKTKLKSLGECINTEFVWEYLTQGFVKVAVRRAVCLLCCSKIYADSEVQKVPLQYFLMRFSLPSIIIIAITSNEP